MKVVLDLKHSFSNYEWDDVKELKDFIDNYMLDTLWKFYDKNNLESGSDLLTDEEINKLYDILDMFRSYEIKGSD